MSNIVRNFVECIGIAKSLPKNPVYFKEVLISETVAIPKLKPDIGQLLSIGIDLEVISTRLIDTAIAVSKEGESLYGCKVVVELNIREKIRYLADDDIQSVNLIQNNILKNIFIVVPYEVSNMYGDKMPIRDLIRKNKLNINPYVEDIYAEMKDERTIFTNTTILTDIKFI